MKIKEIAKGLARKSTIEWENMKDLLDNIELGELERNLTKICFIAGMFKDTGPSLNVVKPILKNDYGLTSESIEWCYQLIALFSKYHENFLNSQDQIDASQEYFNLRAISENTNLPKSLIIRIDKDEKKFGITDMNCTLKKENSYEDGLGEVRLFGEVQHRKIAKDILIYVIVYNDKGEVICFNSETSLSTKKGAAIINCTLNFPLDENISAVYLKPVLDPWING